MLSPSPALLAADLNRRVVDSAVWTIGARAVGAGLQAIVFVCLARLLTPVEFGTYTLALVVVNLASIVGQAGLRTAIVQAPQLKEGTTAAAFGLTLAIGLVGWLGIAAAGWLAVGGETGLVLAVCGLNLCWLTWPVVSLALLQRELRFRELMLIELAGSIMGSAGVTLLLAAVGAGVWSLVVGGLVRDGLIAGLALGRSWPGIAWPRHGCGLRPLVGFGGTLTLTNVAQYVSQNVDYLIVGHLLGARALGFYSRAFYMAARLNLLVIQGLHGLLLAAFARANADSARVRSGFLRATRVLSAIAFPLFAGLALTAHDLVGWLLGTEWLELVPTLRVCCLLAAWPSLSTVADAVLKATGELGPQLRRHVLHCLLVVAGAALGAAWGSVGAAVGVTVAACVIYGLLTGFVLQRYRIGPLEYLATLWPGLMLAGLLTATWMGVTALPFTAQSPILRLAILAVSMLVSGGVTAVCLPRRLLGGLRPELSLVGEWVSDARRRAA